MSTLSEADVVRRLVDRLAFGLPAAELAALRAKGLTAATDTLLHAPTQADQLPTPPPVTNPTSTDPKAARAAERRLAQQVGMWWLDRMVTSGSPALERTTWFWHGHYATSVKKVKSAALMLAQNQTLRRHALGDGGALTRAMATDPAMLVWLDAGKNVAASPNENLARELMELFTLGHGTYSEADVKAAAIALTGWSVDRRTGKATFTAKRHNPAQVSLLGKTAAFDVDSLVTHLLAQPAAPRFVAARLWYRYVTSATPPPDVIERLAAAYGTGHDVRALLRAMTAESAFRDTATSQVKAPVDWLVGLCRAVGTHPAAWPDVARAKMIAHLTQMGQVPLLPPSVGGWPADGAWLSTATTSARISLARLVAQQVDWAAVDLGKAAPARTEAVRVLLGIDSWTGRSKDAVSTVAADPIDALTVAACSPEYVVSR